MDDKKFNRYDENQGVIAEAHETPVSIAAISAIDTDTNIALIDCELDLNEAFEKDANASSIEDNVIEIVEEKIVNWDSIVEKYHSCISLTLDEIENGELQKFLEQIKIYFETQAYQPWQVGSSIEQIKALNMRIQYLKSEVRQEQIAVQEDQSKYRSYIKAMYNETES